MSPRTGRPKLPEGQKKGQRLELRLNQEELDKIQACADALGISKAEAILRGIDLLSKKVKK